jgi:hypothetical protein
LFRSVSQKWTEVRKRAVGSSLENEEGIWNLYWQTGTKYHQYFCLFLCNFSSFYITFMYYLTLVNSILFCITLLCLNFVLGAFVFSFLQLIIFYFYITINLLPYKIRRRGKGQVYGRRILKKEKTIQMEVICLLSNICFEFIAQYSLINTFQSHKF